MANLQVITVSASTELGCLTLTGFMSEYIADNSMYASGYTHHSQCRDFEVEAEGMEKFSIKLDERRGNFLHDLYIPPKLNGYNRATKRQKLVYDYIHEVFWILKKSNPDYGTFDFKNSKRTGKDGVISLYTHDFFAFFSTYCRNKRIDEILKDLESNPVV